MNKVIILFLPLSFILLVAFNNCSSGNFDVDNIKNNSVTPEAIKNIPDEPPVDISPDVNSEIDKPEEEPIHGTD